MRVPDLRPPLVVAALGLTAGVVLATPTLPMPLRAIAAAAFAFALPGTAISLALLPRAALRRAERVAIAVGGSLSTTIVAAFLLQFLASGLSAGSWAALLTGVVVVGGVVGWLRTLRPSRLAISTAPTAASRSLIAGLWTPGPPGVATREGLVPLSSIAMLAAAGVLVTLSLVVARAGVAVGPSAAFTELWMLPQDGGTAVRIGVANHEGEPVTYRLVVTVDGRRLGTPTSISLADDGSVDPVVKLPAGGPRTRTVEARLWRADQPATDPPERLVRAVVEKDAAAAP